MRKLLLSALIVGGLTFTGASSFATDEQEPVDPTEEQGAVKEEEAPPTGVTAPEDMEVLKIDGEVVNFDEKLTSLTIETTEGETMPLVVKHPTHLQGLKPGDMVTVEVAGQTALSITKAAEPEDVAGPGDPGPAVPEEESTMEEETAPAE